jgi:hypothetical protein
MSYLGLIVLVVEYVIISYFFISAFSIVDCKVAHLLDSDSDTLRLQDAVRAAPHIPCSIANPDNSNLYRL